MWSNFVFSLGATLPVFAVMVLGHLLRRAGLLTHGFCHVGNQLVFHLALPAMLFRQIAGMGAGVLIHGPFVIFGAAASLLSVFLVWIPARLFLRDKTEVGAFTQGAFRGNTALLGSVFLQSISGSTEYAPSSSWQRFPFTTFFPSSSSVWNRAAGESWTASASDRR